MPKWQGWIGSIAMQGKLVSTAPMEYEGSIATPEGVHKGPYKESASVLIAGYLICKSDQLEEVQAWAASCPIHKYPNSSVEIRALVPFPIQ